MSNFSRAAVLDRFASNSVGRLMFKSVQPLVHAVRHFAHPDLPNEHMVTRASYNDRQFSIRHRRWMIEDALAIQQCFEDKQYDMPTGKPAARIDLIYDRIVASGRQPLIIDCGANIGASVLWFSARYPRAHIIGIEPAHGNFELLQFNCAHLDADLRQAAIGAEDGQAFLNDFGNFMGYQITSVDSGVSVEVVSVETLLASKDASRYAPFLLKIDIEGSEKGLFAGDTASINRFPLIILEPHDWLFPGELCSREFFRFHVAAKREFCMRHENVGSISYDCEQEMGDVSDTSTPEFLHELSPLAEVSSYPRASRKV